MVQVVARTSTPGTVREMTSSSETPPRSPGRTRFLAIIGEVRAAVQAVVTDPAGVDEPLTPLHRLDLLTAGLFAETATVEWVEVTVIE